MSFFAPLGSAFIGLFLYIGELWELLVETVRSCFIGRKRWGQFIRQIAEIGYRSQPVVIVTGCFTGSVLAAQALFQLKEMQMETLSGALVSVAMLRELGPVITALMLCGRVGAAMAAEIGTMKVTEQIDALRSMDVHPIDYLVTPRFAAIAVSMPLLIAESAGFGILLSTVIGTEVFGVNSGHWMHHLIGHTALEDIAIAMIKGGVFGLLIVVISCHQGLNARNGAVGVGKGTTKAMVFSALAVLITNFFLTFLLNRIWPLGFAG